jgi:hypothetical protein
VLVVTCEKQTKGYEDELVITAKLLCIPCHLFSNHNNRDGGVMVIFFLKKAEARCSPLIWVVGPMSNERLPIITVVVCTSALMNVISYIIDKGPK